MTADVIPFPKPPRALTVREEAAADVAAYLAEYWPRCIDFNEAMRAVGMRWPKLREGGKLPDAVWEVIVGHVARVQATLGVRP
jgi:hypothetical protein